MQIQTKISMTLATAPTLCHPEHVSGSVRCEGSSKPPTKPFFAEFIKNFQLPDINRYRVPTRFQYRKAPFKRV